jgi:L-histidine Nalpha-methyltransferase
MTTQALVSLADLVLDRIASAVRDGLTAHPKTLPPWLFYDEAGSLLFEQITTLPEYYLTRVERSILSRHGAAILAEAGDGQSLRIVELGAGSADKTRLLLQAAVDRQASVIYEPVDVSASALEAARDRIELEIPCVEVVPRVMDYTRDLVLEPAGVSERRLVLYIGSSIGNFEPEDAAALLRHVRSRLCPGDGFLLGVDLRKDKQTLLAAYNDREGVTAAFNLNLLARLNRELGANFDLDAFAHRAIWNPRASRIEMHLESLEDQTVRIPALELEIDFAAGETLHTENSYKFRPGAVEALLSASGFTPTATWTDPREQFAVCLGQVE